MKVILGLADKMKKQASVIENLETEKDDLASRLSVIDELPDIF